MREIMVFYDVLFWTLPQCIEGNAPYTTGLFEYVLSKIFDSRTVSTLERLRIRLTYEYVYLPSLIQPGDPSGCMMATAFGVCGRMHHGTMVGQSAKQSVWQQPAGSSIQRLCTTQQFKLWFDPVGSNLQNEAMFSRVS